jgi:Na+/H+ antiporter NhaD/arsenite permease-like protein
MGGGLPTSPPPAETLDAAALLFNMAPAVAAFVIASAVIIFRTWRVKQQPRIKAPPEDKERRRRAKLENERIKLIATLTNGMAIAVFTASVFLPIVKSAGINPEPISEPLALTGALGALILHVIGHAVLGLWRSEE